MRLRSLHPGALKVLAVLVAVLSGLMPLAAHAGEPGGAPPASISINLQLNGQFGATAVAARAAGVVNDNGDFHIAVDVTQPEARTLDLISTGGVLYLSADGGPYQGMDLLHGGAGALSLGGMMGGCANATMMGSSVSDLQSLFGPGGDLNAGNVLQPVGMQVIDGVETEHLSGQVDLEQAAPLLSRLLGGIAAACGLPVTMGNLQNLQSGLAGATLTLDTYLQQPGNFPRRINVDLNIPAANVQLSYQLDLTPNDTASPILPPQ